MLALFAVALIFAALAAVATVRRAPRRLKEAAYPADERGRPDLRHYRDPLDYYVRMYELHLAAIAGRGTDADRALAFQRRVHANWGLIAKGQESIPYAVRLLGHAEPVAREDGASILAELGRTDGVVDQLIARLAVETEPGTRDVMIQALGRLKSRTALPALAAIVRDPATDDDTRWTAIDSLGRIVRRRFHERDDPLRAATDWLDAHPDLAG